MKKHNQIAHLLFNAMHRPDSTYLKALSPHERAIIALESELWIKLTHPLLYNLEQKIQDALWDRDHANK